MAVYKKPGISKTRVAQRKLHAVLPKKPEPAVGWFSRIIATLMRKVLGRG